MKSQVKVSDSSTLLKFISEPYVIYTKRGYQPVVDVLDVHRGIEGYLFISAVSLSDGLHALSQANNDKLTGVVALVGKASKERMAPYEVRDPDS
jgi:hypothetical protein